MHLLTSLLLSFPTIMSFNFHMSHLFILYKFDLFFGLFINFILSESPTYQLKDYNIRNS